MTLIVSQVIGRYGITGKAQTAPIKQLSDGQKCRVVFAWLSHQVTIFKIFFELFLFGELFSE